MRFYLEEETEHNHNDNNIHSYIKVHSVDTESDNTELEYEETPLMNTELESETIENMKHIPTPLVSAETSNSREELLKELVFCALGLIISFTIWGLIQERMLTQAYGNDYFEYSYGLVFLNRLGGLLLSGFLMKYYNVPWVHSPLWEYSFPSVANMLSSWCQYEALKYVSFPTQMLAKAFKILPVM
jgi:hypothetical protein